MGWQDAPIVEDTEQRPAWMDAPLVSEETVTPVERMLGTRSASILKGIAKAPLSLVELGAEAGGRTVEGIAKLAGYGDLVSGRNQVSEAITELEKKAEKGRKFQGREGIDWMDIGGQIASPLNIKMAKAVPFASGASGLSRIPQLGKNILAGTATGAGAGILTPVGESDGYFGNKAEQIGTSAAVGGLSAGAIEGLKAVGAGAGNVFGPMLPKIDAAKYLPDAIKERAREYLPKALQGETTGSERAALKILNDPRVGEVEKAGLLKLMKAHNPTLAKQVEDAAINSERMQLEKLAQGTTQEAAIKASNIAKGQTTANFVPKMTQELDAVNQASKTIPLDLSKLNNHLDDVMNTPGIRMSDDAIGVLEGLKEKFKRAAKLGGGTPNAHDIYEIRKSGINEIVDKITGRKNPDVSDKLTAKLTTELKPYIDDAIEKAGGKEWTNILQEYSKGMKIVDQQGLSATALKLHANSPQKLVELAKGNAPEVIEGQFGKGNFSFTDEMSTLNKLPKGQVGPPSLDTSKADAIKKVAESVGKRLEADELGSKGAQKAMKILRADEGTITAPGLISWKVTTANKIINSLAGRGGEATNDALAKFMLTDSGRMEKLMAGLPKTQQQMLLEAIATRAGTLLPAQRAAEIGD